METGKILTEKNNSDNIKLEINEVIEIQLESNPTSEHEWVQGEETDSSIFSLIDPGFIKPGKDKELIGSGGYELFSFKAVSGGTQVLFYIMKGHGKKI